MDQSQPAPSGAPLSLHQAAQLLASASLSVRDAEVRLALAIDRGELPANILRWATEQWEGERLEGNIDRMRTFVARADLDAWLAAQAGEGS
ncbi:hypothetical protein [Dechloromonas sp. H13]|uniref:hypothetical protein n=1 Tax=Dechloromonas sp. H13 TaxID=2570193 RepID=UPI001290DAB7|nr:hypothetical protein [Dechloromonas sp. H13]